MQHFRFSILSGPLNCRIATLVPFRQLPSKPQRRCTGKFTQNSFEEQRVESPHSKYIKWVAKEMRWIKFGNLEYFLWNFLVFFGLW